jgi:hypothetical protein
MAKDGPMLDIFKDAAIKAKAQALLPNLKVRSSVNVHIASRFTCESHYFLVTFISMEICEHMNVSCACHIIVS